MQSMGTNVKVIVIGHFEREFKLQLSGKDGQADMTG